MVRSDTIILPEPNSDSDLRLSCVMEPFRVEHCFSQGPVKALVVFILPRAARIDLHGFDPNPVQPVLQVFGNELRITMFYQQ